MNRKGLIIKIFAFLLSLIFAFAALYEGQEVQAKPAVELCHAKSCTVGGKTCVCCLLTDGSIMCVPCGAVDCN